MIVIIDYDLGNLYSIAKALEFCGAVVKISRDEKDIVNADRLILPGVGAFGDAMRNLNQFGIVKILDQEVNIKKKPLLGICLGMQILADKGYEFGEHAGLGWIGGEVKMFAADGARRIPHVGWNDVVFRKKHFLFNDIEDSQPFYFVHSFCFQATDQDSIAAVSDYGGEFTAAVAKDNIFATQFHPEKSQKNGIQLFRNFIDWKP